jgi:signal transduction histidine kinase/uncharacterized membrane protein affecting hemolysin expression
MPRSCERRKNPDLSGRNQVSATDLTHKTMEARRPTRTLSRTLLISFSSITLLATVLYGSFLSVRSYSDWQRLLGSFAVYLADTLARDLVAAIEMQDLQQVRARLDNLDSRQVSVQACVYDVQGLIAEHKPKLGPACPTTPDTEMPQHLHALAAIKRDQAVLGHITIHIHRRNLVDEVTRQLVPMLGGLACIFGLVFLLTRRLSRQATASLVLLTDRARSHEDGEVDFDLPKDAPQEIVDLAAAFNRLVRDLVSAKQDAVREADVRRAAQKAEKRERLLLTDTISNVPCAVIAQRGDGSMLFVNKAAAGLYGTTVEALLSPDFLRSLTRVDGLLVISQESTSSQPEQIDFTSINNEQYRLVVSRSQVEGTDIKLTIAVDITEVHRLQTQLQFAQRLEMVGTLAGGIAHDFNNLLTPILGYSTLLEAEPLDPGVRAKLAHITEAASRARLVVQQILAFSRQQEPRRRLVSLTTLVTSTLSLMSATIPSTITIRNRVEAELEVYVDTGQIEQVLVNLITNAAQAMRNRAGNIDVRISTRDLKPGESRLRPGRYAQLTVIDDGPGMSDSVSSHVFEPFFTTKPVGEGSGLGLSVAHGIMEGHEGLIEVSSQLGKGTEFSLLIPLPNVASTPSMQHAPGLRIMLIDDSPAVLDVVSELLVALGYAVTGFLDAGSALQHFRNHPEDYVLVMTDQRMPHLCGVELAEAVHLLAPQTPVILLTGYDDGSISNPHVADVIQKPASLATLKQVVERVLLPVQLPD